MYIPVLNRGNNINNRDSNLPAEGLRRNSRYESGSDLGNKRKKTAKMLLALVVIFFLTNFPVHMFNVIM